MKNDEPTDPDELLAKMIAAHGPAPEDVDPHLRKMMADPEAQAAREELRALREMAAPPPPPAPAAVQVASDAGMLIVQAEAASTYVPPTEVSIAEAPRLPSGPVRIKGEIDPRRAATAPMATRGAPAHEDAANEAQRSASPLAARTESEPPPSVEPARDESNSAAKPSARAAGGRKAGLVVGAILFVAGVVVTMTLVTRSVPPKEIGASSMATQIAPPPSTVTGAAASASQAASALSGHATAPSASPSVSASASATGAEPSAMPHTSAKVAPPKVIATVEPSAPPVVTAAPGTVPAPSVAPAVTSAPTAAPVVTSVPSSKPSASASSKAVKPLFKLEKE